MAVGKKVRRKTFSWQHDNVNKALRDRQHSYCLNPGAWSEWA